MSTGMALNLLKGNSPGSVTCIGYLAHPFDKKALWAVIASLFQSVRETQPPIEEGNRSVSAEKIAEYGQPTLKKGIHRLHGRAVKGLFRHDATSWMDLISQLRSEERRVGKERRCG